MFDRVAKKDPITFILENLFLRFDIQLDHMFWSQYVSFFMIGIMIGGSIRGFLMRLLSVRHPTRSPQPHLSVNEPQVLPGSDWMTSSVVEPPTHFLIHFSVLPESNTEALNGT